MNGPEIIGYQSDPSWWPQFNDFETQMTHEGTTHVLSAGAIMRVPRDQIHLWMHEADFVIRDDGKMVCQGPGCGMVVIPIYAESKTCPHCGGAL